MEFNQLNVNLTAKRKDGYPSKKTINLYYKEDKTTRPSTIALYVLFFAVVLLAAAKVLVFDLTYSLAKQEEEVKKQQAYLDQQLETLQQYKDISSQYSRYSFSYLREDEIFCDRMEVVKMLEEAVLPKVRLNAFAITEYIVSLEFENPNLEEAASIVRVLETYDIVEYVSVSTATHDDVYHTTMIITLAGAPEETAGGEQ